MSDLEIKEVCSGTTQLDISYETFCEGSLDIERFHFRRAILDLEQVAPLVDGGGGSSERLQ